MRMKNVKMKSKRIKKTSQQVLEGLDRRAEKTEKEQDQNRDKCRMLQIVKK